MPAICGEFMEKVAHARRDVAASWYFKAWCVSVSVFSIAYVAGAWGMCADALELTTENSMRIWFSRADTLKFPDFHVRRAQTSTNEIQEMKCAVGDGTGGTTQLSAGVCESGAPLTECQLIRGSLIVAGTDDTHHWPQASRRRIDCTLRVTNEANNGTLDDMAWEIEHHKTLGLNSYVSMWFRPNAYAWILVNPVFLRIAGYDQAPFYERSMHYHASREDSPDHQFHFATVINSNFIRSYEPWDFYTSAMNVADLGGLFVFMLLLHKLVMCAVRNAGVPQDSLFLADGKAYAPVADDASVATNSASAGTAGDTTASHANYGAL